MDTEEEVLSLDLEDDSLLYRIRKGAHVVYVCVEPPTFIPQQARRESGSVLRHLRKLDVWLQDWQTLIIRCTAESVTCITDELEPHALKPTQLVLGLELHNILQIDLVERISDRVFKGKMAERTIIVKIARFQHELGYLLQELRAYEAFRQRNFVAVPILYAYVYEVQEERVIGFAMEYLDGPHATSGDLNACQEVLGRIHDMGYVLGDLNRHNWINTQEGMKVIDLEAVESQSEMDIRPSEEMSSLANRLADESGVGKR